MNYVGLMLTIAVLAYLTTSYSAYREILEKNLKVKLTFQNVIFFLIVPITVSTVHLKMAFQFYREGQKEVAKLLVVLATVKMASGIAIFLEFMVHSAIVDAVYEKQQTAKVKVKRETSKISNETLNWDHLKEVAHNPFNYGQTVFTAA